MWNKKEKLLNKKKGEQSYLIKKYGRLGMYAKAKLYIELHDEKRNTAKLRENINIYNGASEDDRKKIDEIIENEIQILERKGM